MPTIIHRPRGVEHPYVCSADQLIPAIPLAGEPLSFGARLEGDIASFECVVSWPDKEIRLPMRRIAETPLDTAALTDTEGHLADAQRAALDVNNAWKAEYGPLPSYDGTYRFEATMTDGLQVRSDVFALHPARWVNEALGQVTGAGNKLVPGSLSWLKNSEGILRARFALRLQPSEHVVGFGERYDCLDQRGRCLDAVVFEQYKAQGPHGRTYLPMPFAHVVGEDGASWGFHVRTSRRTWYDVGATVDNELRVEVDLGEPGVTAKNVKPNVMVDTWEGTPTSVLDSFLDSVGRPEAMPDWIYGLWASGNEWNTQALVMKQMDRHRDEEIPVSVVVIEAWSDEEGFCIFRDACYVPNGGVPHTAADFTYPPNGAWPDPEEMIRELHARGIKVILWQIPLQQTERDLGEQAQQQREALVATGHVVREADGRPYQNRGWWFPDALMPDLSTEQGREWWTAQRRYLVTELDVDGFKTDGGEHAWGHDLCYEDGRRGDEGNNLFPVYYSRAFGDLLRSCGKAPVTFSRAGFTGSQAHGLFWAGDEDSTWEGFRSAITAGVTAGAAGILYWGWDIAGFSGPVPEAELYARAFGASAFMPVMQYHSEFNHHKPPLRDRTPWNVADQRNCPKLVDLARHFVQVRESLRPYLTEQAASCILLGKPLMRALFFDFSDDPVIWEHPDQYMLGDDLVVHPITKPGAERWATYLPAGVWEDFWEGTRYDGSTVVTRNYPWEQVPVFRRVA